MPSLEGENALSNYVQQLREHCSKYNWHTLDAQSEAELIARAAKGDDKARVDMIGYYGRAIIKEACKYARGIHAHEDMVNVGIGAMFIAAAKFDSSRNVRFLSYLYPWLRHYLQRYVWESAPIGISYRTWSRAITTLHSTITELISQGENISTETLCSRTGLNAADVNAGLALLNEPISLDNPLHVNDDTESTLMETLQMDDDIPDGLVKHEEMVNLRECLRGLPTIDKQIVKSFYGVGQKRRKIDEIAEELGVSSGYVKKKKKQALLQLRRRMSAQ